MITEFSSHLDALDFAIEVMTEEEKNCVCYTRSIDILKEFAPRSAVIGHKRRVKILAAIEQLKLLRLHISKIGSLS